MKKPSGSRNADGPDWAAILFLIMASSLVAFGIVIPGSGESWLPSNPEQVIVAAGIIGSTVLYFAWLLVAWLRVGRDPVTPLTDASVLLPGPPPGITPAMGAALMRDEVDDHAFHAALMDLLVQGLIDIKVSSRQPLGLLEGHSKDDERPDIDVLVVDPTEAGVRPPLLARPERQLMDAIRKLAGPGRRLSGISLHFHMLFDAELEEAINGTRLGQFRSSLALTFFVMGAVLAVIFGVGEGLILHLFGKHAYPHIDPGKEFLVVPLAVGCVLGLATAVLSSRVNRRTPAGAQALAMLLAYGNTLQIAGQHSVDLDLDALSPGQDLPWDTGRDDGLVWATALGLRADFDSFMSAATSRSMDKLRGAEAAGLPTGSLDT